MIRLAIFGLMAFVLVGCSQVTPKGELRIDSTPPEVPLTIDGKFVGITPAADGQYFAIKLSEGEHKIETVVDVDQEKQLVAQKTIYVASDTVQTFTLTLNERLTPFGKKELARREAEAVEKAKIVEIEREKAAKLAVEKAQRFKKLRAEAAKASLTLRGHKRAVISIAYSPDGSKVVSGSYDNTAKIWDAISGKLLGTLTGEAGIASVDFSPDSNKIVTAGYAARIWDVETSKNEVSIRAHGRVVSTAAFSPDGNNIVTGSNLFTNAKIWDINTRELIHELSGSDGGLISAAYSPDGSKIIAGASMKSAKIWNTKTGKEIATLQSGGVKSVVFSPDGSKVATGSSDSKPKIWDASTGKLLTTLSDRTTKANSSISFSPNGKKVVSAGKGIQVWDATTGKLLVNILDGDYRAIALSPDGRKIAAATGENAVILDLEKEMAAFE